MENSVLGIHHVTAITDDPQRNIDFYVGVLGLRFVKRTVNFDVPETYHLYYGDDTGQPGTILTFFSWPNSPRGKRGAGQVTAISFNIPALALGYWRERLVQHGVQVAGPNERFDGQVLSFTDHEGLGLELVARQDVVEGSAWTRGPVPSEYAIHGFAGVTLSVTRLAHTETLLTGLLGFQKVNTAGNRTRYALPHPHLGTQVDLLDVPGEARGMESIGSVHHVAWRTANDQNQVAWRHRLTTAGLSVTPVLDRTYFHSIYFREPSGVLFEIATDQPGFPVDEPVAELGTHLKLPPWLEEQRPLIERNLPPVQLPAGLSKTQ